MPHWLPRWVAGHVIGETIQRTGRLFSQPREQTVSVKRPPSCTQAAGPAGLPSPDNVASPIKLIKARRLTEEPKSTGLKATDDGGFPGVRLPRESFDRDCMTTEINTP